MAGWEMWRKPDMIADRDSTMTVVCARACASVGLIGVEIQVLPSCFSEEILLPSEEGKGQAETRRLPTQSIG
jgi:hypothetical protein